MLNPFTRRKILKNGRPGTATVIAMSMREPGATSQNVSMTLQVQVEGLSPYEVDDQWMVNHKQALGFGMQLPIKVDQDSPQKVAIDWDAAGDQHAQATAARRAALASQPAVGTAGGAGGFASSTAPGGAFSGGSAAEPVLDVRSDPELRAKLEQVMGRTLTPGTTERLDLSSDPQMAAQVMAVIAQHRADKQMGGLSGQPMEVAQTSSADDPISQLERLDALRQSGALSQEEFDKQKKKLLG